MEYNIPLFYQPWYLDSVCLEGSWDVALSMQDQRLVGLWPYFVKRKYGLIYHTLPPMTPYLGPHILAPGPLSKTATIKSLEKKILTQLADQVPLVHWQISQGHPLLTNWQPLSWRGFRQTTRYTYHVDLTKDVEDLKSCFTDKTRNQIKSAQGKVTIQIVEDGKEVYNLVQKSFQRRSMKVPYEWGLFASRDKALRLRDACTAYIANYNNAPVAVVYVINDKEYSYLSITGRSDHAPGGSVSLLIWESIKEAKKRGRQVFDFEGSMIENIESFFRSFGGTQTPYHHIYKTSGKCTLLMLQLFNRL